MSHVTCRLTAENRNQLRNPTLGNRVWHTFTFTFKQTSNTRCTCKCASQTRILNAIGTHTAQANSTISSIIIRLFWTTRTRKRHTQTDILFELLRTTHSAAPNSVHREQKCADTIRYDTRCYFNVRSKADISQLNLPHGTDN